MESGFVGIPNNIQYIPKTHENIILLTITRYSRNGSPFSLLSSVVLSLPLVFTDGEFWYALNSSAIPLSFIINNS